MFRFVGIHSRVVSRVSGPSLPGSFLLLLLPLLLLILLLFLLLLLLPLLLLPLLLLFCLQPTSPPPPTCSHSSYSSPSSYSSSSYYYSPYSSASNLILLRLQPTPTHPTLPLSFLSFSASVRVDDLIFEVRIESIEKLDIEFSQWGKVGQFQPLDLFSHEGRKGKGKGKGKGRKAKQSKGAACSLFPFSV